MGIEYKWGWREEPMPVGQGEVKRMINSIKQLKFNYY
jgi:hypothetical protein